MLRDFRHWADMFIHGYEIPIDVLIPLEVLHYCTSNDPGDRALLPQACRECTNRCNIYRVRILRMEQKTKQDLKKSPLKRSLVLRELVFNGHPSAEELLTGFMALALFTLFLNVINRYEIVRAVRARSHGFGFGLVWRMGAWTCYVLGIYVRLTLWSNKRSYDQSHTFLTRIDAQYSPVGTQPFAVIIRTGS